MSSLTPGERRLRGQIAVNESWARTPDRSARTAPARAGLEKTFEAMVPPEITDPVARAKALENARKAYYQRIALASSKARRARRATP